MKNLRQTLITDYFQVTNKKDKESYIPILVNRTLFYNVTSNLDTWYCLKCGADMGPQNPRQFCGKWRCLNFN